MTALSAWGGAAQAADRHETSYAAGNGLVVKPASSQPVPASEGLYAHTNILLFFPNKVRARNTSPVPGAETPASLACVYGFVAPVKGCNPKTVTALPSGGSKLVLIVDAYDDPTATSDLTVYSKQFGLPAITANNFEVVYGSGKKPGQDSTGGWELEESLDVQMAHAMAPNAKVILVEAASSSEADLLTAEATATKLAVAAGGGEISNSWEGGEASNESSYESAFAGTNVVYFASTGDSAGTGFPSVLQNVVGAGGTTINRDGSYNFVSQTSWTDGGGGSSEYITRPSYQNAVKKIVKTKRGVPDFSFDANPQSGVTIYDSTPYEGQVLDWLQVGGTSVSSPALAASINAAGSFAASTPAELTTVYAARSTKADWTDITSGTCGNNGGAMAKKGYDFCTGIGVPNGYAGK